MKGHNEMASSISDSSRLEQLELNRVRWSKVLADSDLARLTYRIETSRTGQIIMTPPATGGHSDAQGEIAFRIRQMLGGRTLPECPISTSDGVKVADVGWYSEERFQLVREQQAFELAPEICVEVLSRSNTAEEMRTKRQLYFEAGAQEVWICDLTSKMHFYATSDPDSRISMSSRCPNFPLAISDG